MIGIGGSYLGARAAIELLKSPFYNNMKKDTPDIYYVGNNINPTYLQEILSICEGKDIAVNVISKPVLLLNLRLLSEFSKSLLKTSMDVMEQRKEFSVPQTRRGEHLKILPMPKDTKHLLFLMM